MTTEDFIILPQNRIPPLHLESQLTKNRPIRVGLFIACPKVAVNEKTEPALSEAEVSNSNWVVSKALTPSQKTMTRYFDPFVRSLPAAIAFLLL